MMNSIQLAANQPYLLQPDEFRSYLHSVFRVCDQEISGEVSDTPEPLPMPLHNLEHDAGVYYDDGPYFVVFIGRVFGVTNRLSIATRAAEYIPYGYRMKTYSLQDAYALWSLWIRLLKDTYRQDTEKSVAEIITTTKVLIPSRSELRYVLHPELNIEYGQVSVNAGATGADENLTVEQPIGDEDHGSITDVGSNDGDTVYSSGSQAGEPELDSTDAETRIEQLADAMQTLMTDPSDVEDREGDLDWELSREFIAQVGHDMEEDLQRVNEHLEEWIAAQPINPDELMDVEEAIV